MTDKKKLASMIVMGLSPKKKADDTEDEVEEMDSDGEESDETVAAQDVLDAIETGDASGLAEALKAFVSMC